MDVCKSTRIPQSLLLSYNKIPVLIAQPGEKAGHVLKSGISWGTREQGCVMEPTVTSSNKYPRYTESLDSVLNHSELAEIWCITLRAEKEQLLLP